MKRESVMFVAAETAAANYFAPLWQRWLASPPDHSWWVILGDGAAKQVRGDPLFAALPVLAELNRRDGNAESYVRSRMPSVLVASAGDRVAFERQAVLTAREIGAHTVQVIDTWYNYARRFADYSQEELPDEIVVIDDIAREEAISEGLPIERLVIGGQPWLECAPRSPRSPRDHVLVLGAPIRRDFGDTLGYDETDIARTVLEAMRLAPDCFTRTWYGPHPEQGRLPTDLTGEMEVVANGASMLARAGTVMGAFSSPMVEAFLGGAKVISIQPGSNPRDMCPLSRHGRIPRVRSVAELIDCLMEGSVPRPDDLLTCLVGSTDRLAAVILRKLHA